MAPARGATRAGAAWFVGVINLAARQIRVKGAATILALSGAILLAGCGGSAQTVTAPAQTVTTTDTVMDTGAASTAAPAHRGHSFTGNGTEELGTITARVPSTITWHCEGCAAFAFTSHLSGTEAINVGSSASSGTSHLDPGVYPDAQVIANGSWSIVISPGG